MQEAILIALIIILLLIQFNRQILKCFGISYLSFNRNLVITTKKGTYRFYL